MKGGEGGGLTEERTFIIIHVLILNILKILIYVTFSQFLMHVHVLTSFFSSSLYI